MPQPNFQLHNIVPGMIYDDFVEAVRANFNLLLNAYLQGANVIQFNGNPGAPGQDGSRGGSMLAIADTDIINAANLPAVRSLIRVDDSRFDPLQSADMTKNVVNAIFTVGDSAIQVLFASNKVVHSSSDFAQYDTMSFTNGAMLMITWEVVNNTRVYTILDMSIQQSPLLVDYDAIVEEVLSKIIIPTGQTLTSQGSVAKSYQSGGTTVQAHLPESVLPGTVTNSLLYIAIQMTEAMQNTNSTVLVAGTNVQLEKVYTMLNQALSSSSASQQITKAKASMPTGDKQPGLLVIQSEQTGSAPASENQISDKNMVMPTSRYGLVFIDGDSLSIDENGEAMATGAQFASFASISKSVNGIWIMSNCDLNDAIGKIYLSRAKFQLAITGTYKLVAGNIIETISGNVQRIVGSAGSTSYVNETVYGNVTRDVKGNDNKTVRGNATISTEGNKIEQVTGTDTETFEGARSITHNGTCTTNYNANATLQIANAIYASVLINEGRGVLSQEIGYDYIPEFRADAPYSNDISAAGKKTVQYRNINVSGLNELVMADSAGAKGGYPRCNANTGIIEWLTAEQVYTDLTGSGTGGSNEPAVIVQEKITNDSIYNGAFVTTKTNYATRAIEPDLTYPDNNIYTCQLDIPPIMGSSGYQLVATSYLKRDANSAIDTTNVNIVFTIISSTGQTFEIDAMSVTTATCQGDTVTGYDGRSLVNILTTALPDKNFICKRLSLLPKRSDDASFFDILAVFEDATNGCGDYVYGYRGYDLVNTSRRWRPGAQVVLTLRLEPMKAMMSNTAGLLVCLNKYNSKSVNMGFGQDYIALKQYAVTTTNIKTIFAYMFQNAAYSIAPADMTPEVYVFDEGNDSASGSDSVSRVNNPGHRVTLVKVDGTTDASPTLAPCLDFNDNLNTEVNINTLELYNSNPNNDYMDVDDIAQFTVFRNPSLFMHCNEGILMMLTSGGDKRLAILPVDTAIYDSHIHDAFEVQYSSADLLRNNASDDRNLAALFDDTTALTERHELFQNLRRITQNNYGLFTAYAVSYDYNTPVTYMVSFKIDFTADAPTIMFVDVVKVNYPDLYIAPYVAARQSMSYTVVRGVNAFMQYSPASMVQMQNITWAVDGNEDLVIESFLQNQVLSSTSAQYYKNTATIKNDIAQDATKTVPDMTTLMPLNIPAMIVNVCIRTDTNPIVAINGTQYTPYSMTSEDNAQFEYALNFMIRS